MIDTFILQPQNKKCDKIVTLMETFYPQLKIKQIANFDSFAFDNISDDQDHIVLFDLPKFSDLEQNFIQQMEQKRCSTIVISQNQEWKYIKDFSSICGVIKRPINEAEFVITINNAVNKLQLEQKLKEFEQNIHDTFPQDVIGIPTMKGFEYLKIDTIIRCEGLQRCTRIVSSDRKDIISAYPIGQFKTLLKEHSFYLSHRSHLINLKKVIRYSREGYIFLNDDSRVPLARRNKVDFISQWKHI